MKLRMNWRDHIAVDSKVCHGSACIVGTRVLAHVILDNLAAGESPQSIAEAYHITPDDVKAALLYAGELARERALLPAIPHESE